MTVNQWDKYADIFDQGIGDGSENLHKNFLDPIIFGYMGNKTYGTVIDAGCGNGYLLNKLADRAENLIGLDYSPELLKKAAKRIEPHKNIRLTQADLMEKLPLEKDSADVIIANMVLQYLPSLDMFASEARRILKNKGMLIVLVDHPGHSLFARAQELAGKKNPHFLESGSYFEEGQRKKNSLWNKALLEYHHRKVGSYMNPFLKGFRLIEVVENTQDGEVPRILGLQFVK
jgi:ubiquinone/menaquinone biosynthesis C-methylase UbiE